MKNKSADDLFSKPLYDELTFLDSELSKQIQELSAKDLTIEQRFHEVKAQVTNLIDKACILSGLTNDRHSNWYDVAIELAGKWGAFASYCGSQISLNKLAPDLRKNGSMRIRDAYKARIEGLVVGSNTEKTVAVSVERRTKDQRTGKIIRKTKTYLVHDEYGQCNVGDRIIALETRPISRKKHHSFVARVNK